MTSLTNIAVLGATGSIGRSALEVISRYQERYRVFALTAGSNVEKLAQLASVWRPYIVAIADESRYKALVEEMRKLGITGVSVAAGADAISDIAGRGGCRGRCAELCGGQGRKAPFTCQQRKRGVRRGASHADRA